MCGDETDDMPHESRVGTFRDSMQAAAEPSTPSNIKDTPAHLFVFFFFFWK